jgi:hypothetical protein
METDNHYELHKICENMRKVNQERRNLGARRKLMKNIETKFKTTTIGILARCENSLGELWGHGLDVKDLSADQKQMREVWECLRSDILNHGNGQLRAAMDELMRYTVEWNDYKIDFIIKDKGISNE